MKLHKVKEVRLQLMNRTTHHISEDVKPVCQPPYASTFRVSVSLAYCFCSNYFQVFIDLPYMCMILAHCPGASQTQLVYSGFGVVPKQQVLTLQYVAKKVHEQGVSVLQPY